MLTRAQGTQVMLPKQWRESSGAGSYSDALGVAQDAQEGLEEAGEGFAIARGRVGGKQGDKALAGLPGCQSRLHSRGILGQPGCESIQRCPLPDLQAPFISVGIYIHQKSSMLLTVKPAAPGPGM